MKTQKNRSRSITPSSTPLLPERFGDWWVEIKTLEPDCLYYFGPFSRSQEAEQMRPYYVEDLTQEGAGNVSVVIKQCYPSNLTMVL